MDLFKPELCATRWTKKHYSDSHPVLNSSANTATIKPTYITTVRIPEEKDRYKKTAKLTSEINNIGAKTTVIGVKRKNTNVESSKVSKRRYIEKSDDDQVLTVLEWLTKKERREIL